MFEWSAKGQNQCHENVTHTTDGLINPVSTSDLKNWRFRERRLCEPFSLETEKKPRSRFSLKCNGSFPEALYTTTDDYNDIFTVNFNDSCLATYIKHCCHDDKPVPNVIHYVWFGDMELKYFNFLSLMSALRFQQPCLIIVHGPTLPHGPYWDHFLHLAPPIVHVARERPTQAFGQPLFAKEHASDLMRIEALMEYGGIYLDFDELLLRPLHPLRKYPYTQGHEMHFSMGSQLVMAARDAPFLRMWYYGYRDDYRRIWAYNALWVPNTLAKKHPDLIHVEGYNFTRPSWKNVKLIFDANYDWSSNYGMHMYARWYRRPIDVTSMRTLNTTVGSVSRYILLGNKELCINT
ncbi:uncharacterized protein LOC128235861 [Mya arenaria]|uniref:uncharacterized protein LOC128235861 n=1 Tax=Mya arenaria TaxID=6604 RepID=UPI0022E30062|nr:uncharacterized protein LOC128235861 [Mya arenaria]